MGTTESFPAAGMVAVESCARGRGRGTCGITEMVEHTGEARQGQSGWLGGGLLRMLITGVF